jgi:hypothetical protein
MVYGSSPVQNPVQTISTIRRPITSPRVPVPIGPAYPIANPQQWGANPPGWESGMGPVYGGTYGYSSSSGNPNLPSSANNLAQLTLQYQSNPASLTASSGSNYRLQG